MVTEVAKGEKVKAERFFLTSSTTDIVAKTDTQVTNFASRYTYAPIWTYTVPTGQVLVMKPEYRFSAYIEDEATPAAEWLDTQQVRIEVWDASKRKMQIPYYGLYLASKEETDLEKMARLQINDPILLQEGDQIFICGMADVTVYTIDVSASRFSLELERIKPSMF